MDIAIIEAPFRTRLHGTASAIEGRPICDVGMKLMDELWRIVKQTNTATTGINHWVYLPDDRMLVAVALADAAPAPEGLQPIDIDLPRYAKHVHVGPYQALPAKWDALKSELAARGETIGLPSLEVYDHCSDNPEKLETTILIGLPPKTA